jgi:hypothetical protein
MESGCWVQNHTLESFTWNSDYKDFGCRELLMGIMNVLEKNNERQGEV